VLSGINDGQNLGAFVDASGTIGAAREAAGSGIPAFAVSQGLAEHPDYRVAATMTIDWLERHRDALAERNRAARIESLNVPTCRAGTVRGIVRVPIARSRDGATDDPNCASASEDFDNDIEAFQLGFATISRVPLTPRAEAS
jgi:5'-nucleotidase